MTTKVGDFEFEELTPVDEERVKVIRARELLLLRLVKEFYRKCRDERTLAHRFPEEAFDKLTDEELKRMIAALRKTTLRQRSDGLWEWPL